MKKYLPINESNNFYKNYAEAIHSETGKNVAISNRDKIVATAGDNEFKNKYLNKPVSVDLDEVIQNRYIVKYDKQEYITLADGVSEKSCCVVAPICSDEDAIGTVIICSKDNSVIDDFIVKTSSIAAMFLGKNMVDKV